MLAAFRERVAPMTYNAHHPGSFSYFTPPPLPMSIAGEVLAQWLQQGVDVWHAGPVGAFVEEEVVALAPRPRRHRPDDSWGVLTSGGVMANLMALTVARDIHLAALRGTRRPAARRDLEGVRVYASDQTHFSVARGLDVLGFPRGHAADRARATTASGCTRARSRRRSREDRAAGLVPARDRAVAGSTNTGSVDDVVALGALARAEGLLAARRRGLRRRRAALAARGARVPGLELADSVTVDPHKWFFQAYDIGALVVRRRDDLLRTFHRAPEYYRSNRPEDEPLDWYQYSIEGTRRFRALKLWMTWQHLGTRGLGWLDRPRLDLAALLAARLREAADLDLACDPELSVVCFRHLPAGLRARATRSALDAYQTACSAPWRPTAPRG